MPGMPPQGMPGGPMRGPMPGNMGGSMGGGPPQGGYGQYGSYPGTFGAQPPPANDPMWGYFTAIAGQVSLDACRNMSVIVFKKVTFSQQL